MGEDLEAVGVKALQRFFGEQMNLPKIRHAWVLAGEMAVLNGGTRMRITFDAEAFDQINPGLRLLAKAMMVIARDGSDCTRQAWDDECGVFRRRANDPVSFCC